MNGKVNRACRE